MATTSLALCALGALASAFMLVVRWHRARKRADERAFAIYVCVDEPALYLRHKRFAPHSPVRVV